MLPRTLVATAALAALVAAPAQAAQISTTFTTVGESVFVVPAGVHRVDVELIGARGGNGFFATWAQGDRTPPRPGPPRDADTSRATSRGPIDVHRLGPVSTFTFAIRLSLTN